MLENVKAMRDKEIPCQLTILKREIEEQSQIIKSLREVLSMVLRDEQPLEVAGDKDDSPDRSPLGGKIKTANRRLMLNTDEIRRIIDDLEL